MEHRAYFSLVAVAGSESVEHNLVAYLGAFKLGSLFLALEQEWGENAVGYLNAVGLNLSVLGKLHDSALDEGAVAVFLSLNALAGLLAQILVLLLDHIVAYGDIVEVEFNALVEYQIEFGHQSDFVSKCIVFLVEIQFLVGSRDRLAEDSDIVVVDIFESSIGGHVVQHVSLHVLAETLLKLSHVDVAFAEAGDLTGVADFLKLLLDAGSVVAFFDFNDYTALEVARLFECYVHYVSFFYL